MADEVTKKEPFKLERSLYGAVNGYMDICERVGNGTLETAHAREMIRSLNGIPTFIKAQLETIRVFEKGSQKAKEAAAKILNLGTVDQQMLEHGERGTPQ